MTRDASAGWREEYEHQAVQAPEYAEAVQCPTGAGQ